MSEEESARERKVRFHGRVQFKTIRHVADFSDEEIVEGWYRKKDFMRMSEDVSKIAEMMAKGQETHNGEELYIRGLEHLVEEDVADYRAEKMIASIDAVLDEQDEQRDEDVNEPDVIARLYTDIVTPLQREAYLIGLRDAKEATVAADQISDIVTEEEAPKPEVETQEVNLPVEDKKLEKTAPPPKPVDEATSVVSTELLNDAGAEKASKQKVTQGKATGGSNGAKSKETLAAERKAAAEKRKNRVRQGVGTELSPLVRRRDGSFAFRNKELDKAKKELSQQRRDCVRDALFKHLDFPESASLGIR